MAESMRSSSTPLCGDANCCFKGATYRCQRCWLEVCYCSGSDTAAVCDDCFGDLDDLGFEGPQMALVYGTGDHTIREGTRDEGSRILRWDALDEGWPA